MKIRSQRNFLLVIFLLVISQLTFGLALQTQTESNEIGLNSITLDQSSGPTITDVVHDILEPIPSDSVEVTASITDPIGIQNVTLYYQYTSISGPVNATDMLSTSTTEAIDDFNIKTVHLDPATGYSSVNVTGLRVGTYFRDNIEFDGLIINSLTNGQQSSFVNYYSIDVKNTIDGEWTNVDMRGDTLGSVDLEPITTSYNQKFFGLNITAVTNGTDSGNDGNKYPNIDADLLLFGDLYNAFIPAPNKPTNVTYYIEAYSDDNNFTRSPDFTFLFDTPPQITENEITRSLSAEDPIFVNVTVTDADGIETVPNGNVYADYRVVGTLDWTNLILTKGANFSSTQAHFVGSEPLPSIELEGTFEMIITAIDEIEGVNGRSVTFNPGVLTVDTIGPIVSDLQLIGPNVFNNNTNANLNVTMEVEFTDPAGIRSASIYYSKFEEGTYKKLEMMNQSDTARGVSPLRFNVTILAAKEDAVIYYYLESMDFLNNTATTPVWFYYADALGPIILDNAVAYDSVVTTQSGNFIVFNATDTSEIDELSSFGYYSQDEENWVQTSISAINYGTVPTNYNEKFAMDNLPLFFENNPDSTYNISIIRRGNIQIANLRVDFTHPQSFDLRMWLVTDDGNEFLIFDRLQDSDRIDINLVDIGLVQKDFDSMNFTLVIDDRTEMFSGTLDKFEITLVEYEIPFPYQFRLDIPAATNDSNVYFFLQLFDKVGNEINSSTFIYYSDGGLPLVELLILDSLFDAKGGSAITISANVIDNGTISDVEIYFRFTNDSNWEIEEMHLLEDTTIFEFEVPLVNSSGNLTYWIRAFDTVGNSGRSNITSIIYENANITSSENSKAPEIIAITLGILAFGGIILIILNSMGKIPESVVSKLSKLNPRRKRES